MEECSMPICLTPGQFKKIEELAKQNGMLNISQALEKLLEDV